MKEDVADKICFFFNDTATTEIYTLSLHDALPICRHRCEARHIDSLLISSEIKMSQANKMRKILSMRLSSFLGVLIPTEFTLCNESFILILQKVKTDQNIMKVIRNGDWARVNAVNAHLTHMQICLLIDFGSDVIITFNLPESLV